MFVFQDSNTSRVASTCVIEEGQCQGQHAVIAVVASDVRIQQRDVMRRQLDVTRTGDVAHVRVAADVRYKDVNGRRQL